MFNERMADSSFHFDGAAAFYVPLKDSFDEESAKISRKLDLIALRKVCTT